LVLVFDASTSKGEDHMHCRKQVLRLTAASIAFGLLAAPGAAMAQKTEPLSFVASPDVYKVIADKGHFRMVLATWQPGQRDLWHSHPDAAVYFVTNCALRIFKPDGTHQDYAHLRRGHPFIQPPISSHEAQNIGKNVCKVLMVELK
jgi:hypothetical protein